MIVVRHNTQAIIHVHSPGVNGIWAAMLALLGYSVVTHTHGLEWRASKWPRWFRVIMKASEWAALAASRVIVTVSDEEAAYYRGKLPGRWKRVVVIPNGCSDEMPTCETCSNDTFAKGFYLYAGRLVPQKRVDLVIRALSKLPTRRQLVIAGEGSLTDDYVTRIRTLCEEHGNAVMVGWVDQVTLRMLYRRCLAFVLFSETEGCPNALIEAISCGCICVVSDIAVHRQLCGDAVLYIRKDDEAALSAALDRIGWDTDLQDEYRSRAQRHRLSLLSWGRVAELIYQEYQLVSGL